MKYIMILVSLVVALRIIAGLCDAYRRRQRRKSEVEFLRRIVEHCRRKERVI
jgi:hypothetical protein